MKTPISFSDLEVWARTLWGEARGEPAVGKLAVAYVIWNRTVTDLKGDGQDDWWGETISGVCRAPWQFSCWNATDPNLPKLLAVHANDREMVDCVQVIADVLAGCPDPTKGATHYLTRALYDEIQNGTDLRSIKHWARGRSPCASIGSHCFFNNVS